MGYVGSYIWQIRQKVGSQRLITATVGVLPVDESSRIKMVFVNHFGLWMHIGGHVELGDSWETAVIHELKEEAGILTNKENLELFATISGPGRIYHYQDGTTQSFTNVYLVKKWQEEIRPTDDEEISKTKWMSLAEIKKLKTHNLTRLIIEAYEKYLETGKVQTVED
ncbi:MAG: NUDIX hydrolase [Candidatus Nomurabacteria bacterium]|jgi:ADP-ribose pyrophosphatase YjhB (NUDIX family)|nr:NUDIX hydrolase [Candidatus Nomurabacteria bacterium]